MKELTFEDFKVNPDVDFSNIKEYIFEDKNHSYSEKYDITFILSCNIKYGWSLDIIYFKEDKKVMHLTFMSEDNCADSVLSVFNKSMDHFKAIQENL